MQSSLGGNVENWSVGYAGGVTPMPHESGLLTDRATQTDTIPASSLEENETARLSFITAARRAGNTALCQLKAMVDTDHKCKKVKDHDPFFQLEILWLRWHQVGVIRHTYTCKAPMTMTMASAMTSGYGLCLVSGDMHMGMTMAMTLAMHHDLWPFQWS